MTKDMLTDWLAGRQAGNQSYGVSQPDWWSERPAPKDAGSHRKFILSHAGEALNKAADHGLLEQRLTRWRKWESLPPSKSVVSNAAAAGRGEITGRAGSRLGG